MANEIYMDGVDSSGNTITNDGSAYKIGDGVVLTAAHVVLEFNEVNNPTNRAILTRSGLTIYEDFRDYQTAYYNAAFALSNPLPSPSSPSVTVSMDVEAGLTSKDFLMVNGGGSVTSSHDGLAVFLSPGDMVAGSADFLTGATFHRYAKTTGHKQGDIVSLRSGGGFNYSEASSGGDSGGGYLVEYGSRKYVMGIQSAQNNSTGYAIGTYLTKSEWDTINESLETSQSGNVTKSEPHNLVVGSTSGDTFVGSYRADLLLGRGGNDTISDGESSTSTAWGDDTLVGGSGDDTLIANQGNDILWGGDEGIDTAGDNDVANYVSSKPVAITFNGISSTPTLSVRDGYGGNDELHSIEKVIGTLANDQLQVLGTISTGTTLTIDANGGQGPNPADSINLKGATSGTQLTLNSSGAGSVQTSGGGQINLLGFHTQIIGSDYDDEISDDSSGQKRIDGRDGDDEISVAGTSSNVTLIGGNGNDTLTGGAGNDIIIADGNGFWVNEDNDIYGGDGSDFIVSASVGNVIDAGDGTDYIKLLNSFSPTIGGGPYRGLYITGGEGNDVIDAAGNMGFTINFGTGDGHDTIISNVSTINSSINIEMGALSPSDLTIIWDVPDFLNYHTGDLAIIINSTGESIFIPQVFGYIGTGNQHTVGNSYGFNNIYINGDQFTTGLGYTVTMGDTNSYDFGADDYEAATALSSGDTTGTSGDDNLIGGSGDDSLSGGDGDDNFTASYGNDTIDGGDGDDSVSLVGSRTDYIVAQDGGDIVVTSLRATEGEMTLTSVENIYFLTDGDSYSQQDLFGYTGTSGADTIYGSYLNNAIDAQAGNDTIFGLGGDDTIDGGDGDDVVNYAGSASDYQVYKDWDGSFVVLSAASQVGAGRLSNVESIYFEGSDTTAILADQILTGTSGADTLTGDYGYDTLSGLAGNDTLTGGAGDDILDGGDGTDIAEFSGSSANSFIFFDTDGSLVVGGVDGRDVLTDIEALHFAGDNVTLGLNDIPALGTSGVDTITGSTRRDRLFGLEGNDSLTGGDGDDELDGGEGADTMAGGDGDDYYYVDNVGDVIIEASNEGEDDGVESSVTHTLSANIEGLSLVGESAIDGTGNALGNYISGNDAENVLSGVGGDDELDAYDGDDTLIGGTGDDYLYGGDGDDTAVYTGNSNDYTINTDDGEIQIVDDAPSVNGDDGTDILYEIEHAQFTDQTVNLATPIALDLNGDGVNLIARNQSRTKFDWDADGKGNKTGWIGKDDGLLVFDRNGDGKVSNASELSFVGDKKGAKSDLDGLSAFDSNHDGIFSADDEQFANFRVWRDENGNGKSDKRELMTLADAGIASINLAGTAVNQNWDWGDNLVINTGSFSRTDGTQGALSDVALNYADDAVSTSRYVPSVAASRFVEAIASFKSKGGDEVTLGRHDAELTRVPVFAGEHYRHI